MSARRRNTHAHMSHAMPEENSTRCWQNRTAFVCRKAARASTRPRGTDTWRYRHLVEQLCTIDHFSRWRPPPTPVPCERCSIRWSIFTRVRLRTDEVQATTQASMAALFITSWIPTDMTQTYQRINQSSFLKDNKHAPSAQYVCIIDVSRPFPNHSLCIVFITYPGRCSVIHCGAQWHCGGSIRLNQENPRFNLVLLCRTYGKFVHSVLLKSMQFH